MPSGKNRSSDTQPESGSRRSSLRRLSSIASFQTLNPFNRRRSNNVTSSPSTASNLSLSSSTTANALGGHKEASSSQIFNENDDVGIVPPLPSEKQLPPRRNSYVCLPDDPIGGMPRSRTFSNLPLPSRKKNNTNALVQSKSHARLPSTSRIPTPTTSGRKYSNSRLPSLDLKQAPIRKKLIRSDTEPLLQHALEQPNMPRSTAFKENISLSPIKPLPSMLEDDDRFGFINSSRSSASRNGWSDSSDAGEPLLGPPRKSSLPVSQRTSYGDQPRRFSQKFNSSPVYRPSRERAPTPGKPVQRWNSQPLFTNRTNIRASYGEIKQTRLMSERGPPTPPPTKSSLSRELSGNDLTRVKSTSGYLRQASELPPFSLEERLQPTSARPRAESLKPKPGAITTAQPLAYWTGRFSSLNDRYRNEELAASFLPSQHTSSTDSPRQWQTKSETNKLHTTEANSNRMRRAIEHLFSLCATDQAKESFIIWQKAVARALGMPELGWPVKGSEDLRKGWNLEMSLRSSSMANLTGGLSHPTSGESRKLTSFVDRLLGRRQKSEALLVS